jgi:hypothetical protein
MQALVNRWALTLGGAVAVVVAAVGWLRGLTPPVQALRALASGMAVFLAVRLLGTLTVQMILREALAQRRRAQEARAKEGGGSRERGLAA